MATTKRTDIHRPGAIVPANYRLALSYSLAGSEGGIAIPSVGVNCELDYRNPTTGENGKHREDGMCCIIGLLHIAKVKFAATGDTGHCSICGSHFRHGDVWVHESGEHIHVGWECADKYSMLTDRSAHELAVGRARAAAATAITREQNRESREAFLEEHEGLADALATDHPIVKDIAAKFQSFCSLSDKQIALVMKLADEARNPKAPEVLVDAPEGKVTFRGVVVSAKAEEGQYGMQYRMTVKVTTPEGVWLAWGTIPVAIFDAGWSIPTMRGIEVEVTATLKRGRDKHFAITKRPRGKAITPLPKTEAQLEREREESVPCEDPFAIFENVA